METPELNPAAASDLPQDGAGAANTTEAALPATAEGTAVAAARGTEYAAVAAQPELPPVSQLPVRRRRKHRRSDMLGSIQSLAVTIVIAVFVITFIVQAFQIPSESMEDTLLIGDYLLVDKVHFAHGGDWGEVLPYSTIHRGDIIVFRYPVHPEQHFVKRVIGVPGDHIRLKNKQVFVNDEPLRESYTVYRSVGRDPYRDDFPRTDFLNANVEARWWLQMRTLVRQGELTVPPGRYFVLGDNRDESLDSRYWGFVPRENIVGRPLLIYWSMRQPSRIGPVAESMGDKLMYLGYAVTHLLQEARWDRTLRLIR